MSREKFIVLDVEGMSNARPYNIGYIVADRYGKIYKRRSFAFTACIWENIQSCLRSGQAVEMTHKNIQEILNDQNNRKRKRKYQLVSIAEFFNIFNKDIQRFKVKRIFAYNVMFDKSAINRLLGDSLFDSINVEWCDIISGILTTKLMTKKYIIFCIENGYVTAKGNPQYKAEIVYRYLTDNLNFEEEHTGLADVLIEYEILLIAFKAHRKLDFTPCQAWRKLRDYANSVLILDGVE